MTSERTYYGLSINGQRASGESLFASLDDARLAARSKLGTVTILAIVTDEDDNVLRSRIVETA